MVGGDTDDVSIHAPTWGATKFALTLRLSICFNPRTHMGCDCKEDSYCLAVFTVSIHAPTWGATQMISWYIMAKAFQSTHPHGVRLFFPSSPITRDDVSIHAPTWGATLNAARCLNWKTVSIHAPTWGATAGGRRMTEEEKGFNPRTHMGCDIASLTLALIGCCFNPRTHMGCDCIFSNRLNITMQR